MTISIKPTASGSTIEQDGSTILTVDGSGNLTVANNLSVTGTAPSIDALSTATGSAPSYSARAWVNFNGTGTVAIRASGNVSSITDYGTGNYGVNFTTAMPDANYSQSGFIQRDDDGTTNTGFIRRANNLSFQTINNTRIIVQNPNLGNVDPIVVAVAVFR
jgi:hypothetical protein